MKQRRINSTLFIAAAFLATLLILTALSPVGTASPRIERQPRESLTALNTTEATESEEDVLLAGLNSSRVYLPLAMKQVPKLIVYPGPSNVDYGPGVELSPGTQLTAVGRYGDFVKVQWVDEGGKLQEGFVWAALLREVPEDLPELSKDEVPWIERTFILPDHPVRFFTHPNYDSDYILLPVYASVMDPEEDLKVQVSLDVNMEREAPDTSTAELWVGNGMLEGEEIRKLYLLYLNGGESQGWNLAYQVGDAWGHYMENGSGAPLFVHLPVSGRSGDFTLEISKNGGVVSLTLPEGQVRTFYLKEALPLDVFGLSVQTGPFCEINMSRLSLSQAPTGTYEIGHRPESLRKLADEVGITIGTPGAGWIYPYDLAYKQVLGQEFDLLVTEFYWDWLLRPNPNTFNFALTDLQVDFATKNGMRVRGHPLVEAIPVWAEGGNPAWLEQGNYSREELIQIIREHISAVINRYRGRIDEWVVVNEAMWEGEYVESLWLDRIGPEYIEFALRVAREVDPNAILILNFDRNEEINRQSDGIYNLIADLKARGVPLDGVGMEMHLFATNPPDKANVIANMRRFGELGVKVYITELDVNTYGIDGTEEEKQALQARIYRDMLEACLESGVCESFTMWGFKLPYSWLLGPNYPYGPAETYLVFDEEGNPNQTYFALLEALRAAASQP